MIRLEWMNGLAHNYRMSLELVEQQRYRDLDTNAFPIDVRWANAVFILGKRWRRWSSIKTTLG